MSDDAPILYAVDDGVARITLNRPATLNALNPALMRALLGALDRVAADADVRVVVLTGAGRGFCSGADLGDAAQDRAAPDPADGSAGSLYNDVVRAIAACPVPTVARINGVAAGGGMGLALACDISVAAASAGFVATFGPRLGIVPDLGVTWHLPLRAGRARALGTALLGERISAAQAVEWGLIWTSVADDALDAEVARIAAVLKRSSPAAATRIRSAIDLAFRQDLGTQLDLEMRHQAVLIPRNMQEGARAFLQKRDPVFDGRRD